MINSRFNHPSLSSTSLLHKSIPEIYCSCGISIIPTAEASAATGATTATGATNTNAASSSIIAIQSNGTTIRSSPSSPPSPSSSPPLLTEITSCQTTAYFRDTKSKRAKVVIPVLLSFANEFERKAVIRSGAIQPIPVSPISPILVAAKSGSNTTTSDMNSSDEQKSQSQSQSRTQTPINNDEETVTTTTTEKYGGLEPDPLGGLDGLGSFGGSGTGSFGGGVGGGGSTGGTGGPGISAGADLGAATTTTRTGNGWGDRDFDFDSSLGDGSDLWSSELDTLGEARGGSHDGSSCEKLELKFECFSFVKKNNKNKSNSNGNSCDSDSDNGQNRNNNEQNEEEEVVIIEGVTILSTSMVDTADTVGIRFDVEIAVRCPSQSHAHANTNSSGGNENININRTNLNIKSVLVCTSSKPTDDERNFFDSKRSFGSNGHSFLNNATNGNGSHYGNDGSSFLNLNENEESSFDNIFLAKQALDMGVHCISPYENESNLPTSSYFARSLSYSLPSGGGSGSGVYNDYDDDDDDDVGGGDDGNDNGNGNDNVDSATNTNTNNYNDRDRGLHVKLSLVPATTIHVREVSGASSNSGVTLVSLLICHSNLHNEDVTITNIALHPGHSRLFHSVSVGFSGHGLNGLGGVGGGSISIANSTANTAISTEGPTMPGGESAVMNMIKHVRWGYAKGTSPSMPFTLKPQEAVATVIQINASEDSASRTFVSPICVRGIVGLGGGGSSAITTANTSSVSRVNSSSGSSGDGVADTYRDESGNNTSMIMDSADARWTTSRVILGKADAFRINLSLQETQCNVGAQVVVSLKVMNLSDESRDLMLLMAKEEHPTDDDNGGGVEEKYNNNNNAMTYTGGTIKGGISSVESNEEEKSDVSTALGINNAIVYEVNGYTFGVWGLSGEDDGTVRYNRDHELLAVDAALLLGEVKGQHSIDAELRFVPLREGILKVPNLKLYDKYTGSWYDCVHTLQIITAPNQ